MTLKRNRPLVTATISVAALSMLVPVGRGHRWSITVRWSTAIIRIWRPMKATGHNV